MSEKLEEKTVEVIDKAMDGMDQLTIMLAEVAEQYGPEVVDAGLAVARISAGAALVHAAIGLALIYALFRLGIPLTLKFRAMLPEHDQNDFEFIFPIGFSWGIVGGGTMIAAFAGFGAEGFFNLWNWVGLVEPKLWIAHRVLGW